MTLSAFCGGVRSCMSHETPQVHVVQLDIAWETPDANHAKVRDRLRGAGVRPGDLVVLPEMFATGFSFRIPKTHDGEGRTLAFLAALAQEFRVTVQGGRTLPGLGGGLASNVMTVVASHDGEPATPLIEYAKIHPFQREGEVIAGGSRVGTYPWRVPGGREVKVCPAICYDLRFPELFREGLTQGAEVYALGACWPSVRAAHWRALTIARAIENQAFFIACNRVGDDPSRPIAGGLHYAGGSLVVSPLGEVAGELGDAEGVLTVPIDVAEVDAWRSRFPAWNDRKLR